MMIRHSSAIIRETDVCSRRTEPETTGVINQREGWLSEGSSDIGSNISVRNDETNIHEVEGCKRPLFSQVTDDTIGSKYKPRFVCGLDFKNQTNEISSDRLDRRVNSGP